MLKVSNICKKYCNSNNSLNILNGINLHIKENEAIAIMGNSGSGKSTLARILLRLEKIDSGEIFFQGQDITNLTNKNLIFYRRQVQFIAQRPESFLDPLMTIEKSLYEPVDIFGLKINIDDIKNILELLQLNFNIIKRYPHQVSGGEIQRICLARALLLKPKLLILDEPTSMLDISVQAQIMHLLRDIKKYEKLSYLFITHDYNLATFLCNKILRLENGKLQIS